MYILHIRSLISALHKNNYDYSKVNIKDFASKPLFIPEDVLLIKQLDVFRSTKQHIAIVINEYGDVKGLITLEDILEEIVGPIEDENDNESKQIQQKSENIYLVDAAASIREINRELNLDLPENANTIAGLLINECRYIPKIGEKISVNEVVFTIKKKEGPIIKDVSLSIISEDF